MVSSPTPGRKYYSHEEMSAVLEDETTSAAEIQEFINAGLDCDQHFGYSGSLLTLAIECGNLQVVHLLLANGANPNHAAGIFGWFPLHWAADEGDTAIAQALVGTGAEIQGTRALLKAAANLHNDMIRYLLAIGAPLEERYVGSENGAHKSGEPGLGPPLLQAVRADCRRVGDTQLLDGPQHVEAVQILLNAGADVTAKDSDGLTALEAAEILELQNVAALLRRHEIRLTSGALGHMKQDDGS